MSETRTTAYPAGGRLEDDGLAALHVAGRCKPQRYPCLASKGDGHLNDGRCLVHNPGEGHVGIHGSASRGSRRVQKRHLRHVCVQMVRKGIVGPDGREKKRRTHSEDRDTVLGVQSPRELERCYPICLRHRHVEDRCGGKWDNVRDVRVVQQILADIRRGWLRIGE